jgi:hypothetical protein
VVPAEPDGQVGQVLHRERPLASQGGGDIAVAYIHRALAHRPRLGHRLGGQQRVIAAHNPVNPFAQRSLLVSVRLAGLLRLDGNSALQEEWTALVRAQWAAHRAKASETGSDGQSRPDTTAAWAALEQAVIGKAVDLLSGPGGLASFLRRRQLGVRLAGPSLPLDIGYSDTIPAGIRNAVIPAG